MQLYWLETTHIFIWILFLFLLSHFVPVYRYEYVMRKKEIRCVPWFAIAAFLPVILMAAFGKVRGDVWMYLSNYRKLPDTIAEGWTMVQASETKGYTLFALIVKQVFGGSQYAFRVIMALFHTIPLIIMFRKYSENFLFSFYIFIAAGNHLAWLMNGQRQFMAVAVIFMATPWIVEKKFVRSILMIFLASMFHTTALFMIPVIFIVQGKAWSRRTIFFIMCAIAAAILFSRDARWFDNFAESIGYSLESSYAWGDDGMNPLRVAVYAVPAILAFISRNQIRKENNKVIDICVNM